MEGDPVTVKKEWPSIPAIRPLSLDCRGTAVDCQLHPIHVA